MSQHEPHTADESLSPDERRREKAAFDSEQHKEHEEHEEHDVVKTESRPESQRAVDDAPLPDEGPGEAATAARGPAHAALSALSKDEVIDRHLRLVADHRRLRQRAEEEKLEARRSERDRVLLSFFEVVDNVERGLEASAGEQSVWREGMENIHKQMLDVISGYGVVPFAPVGEPFDAHEQEALCMMPAPGKADGTVAQVERKGYRTAERVLRPARVVVVKNA